MPCGLACDIIAQDGKNIKVLFEDGTTVNSTLAQYAMKRIERPVYPNEQRFTKKGRVCYLKTFHGYHNVDVIFPNGDYINNLSFRDFAMNNIDDNKIISFMESGANPIHFITYTILNCYCSNVVYNTNDFDIYIPPLDLGINTRIKYAHTKSANYKGASKVFTIAERDAKVTDNPKNTTFRLSANLAELKDKHSIYSYFYDLEQVLKELAYNIGIDKDYIRITDEMIKSVCGLQKKWNYLSYLFVDSVMRQ